MLPSMSNLSIESKGHDVDHNWDELPHELRKNIVDLSLEDRKIKVARVKTGLTSVYMKDGQFTLQYDALPARNYAGQKYMEELIRLQTLPQNVQLTSDNATEAFMTVMFNYVQDAGSLDFEVPLSSQIGQKMERWLGNHPDTSIQIKRNAFNLYGQDGLLRVSFPLKLFQASPFESWLVQNARATFCEMFKVIVEHLLTLQTTIIATVSKETRNFDHMFFLDITIPALRRVLDSINNSRRRQRI